jgi:hypothetical protein
MDWNERAAWTISDLEGNSLTLNDSLDIAYYKARALNPDIAGIREISPVLYELVLGDGSVINKITKEWYSVILPKSCWHVTTRKWDEMPCPECGAENVVITEGLALTSLASAWHAEGRRIRSARLARIRAVLGEDP